MYLIILVTIYVYYMLHHSFPRWHTFQPFLLLCFVFMTVENDNRGTKPTKSSKTSNRARRPRLVPAGKDSKDSRHPFALYGSGDKAADIAGRKTHNVRPAASTHEVISVNSCVLSWVVTEHTGSDGHPYFPCRSTSRLYGRRPGGK